MRVHKIGLEPIEFLLIIPFAGAPVLFGMAPKFCGPALLCLLAGVSLCELVINWRRPAQPALPWCIMASACLFIGGLCPAGSSLAKEHGLTLSFALLYTTLLTDFIKRDGRNLGAPGFFQAGLVWAVLSGGWITACIACGTHLLYPKAEAWDIALGNPNVLALHLALILPVAAALIREARVPLDNFLLALLMATCVMAMLLSKAMGHLGIAVSVCAWLWMEPSAASSSTRRFFIPVLCLAAGLITLQLWNHPESFWDRLEWQKAAWRMTLDHPLFGGARDGGFSALYPAYRASRYAPFSNFAHNLPLEVLSHWGLTGASLIVLWIWSLVRRSGTLPRPLIAVWITALLTGLYDSSMIILPNVMALAGLTLAYLPVRFAIEEYQKWARPIALVTLSLLSAGGFRLAAGRYHILNAGSWIGAVGIIDDAPARAAKALRRSLRWDPENPEAWAHLAEIEAARARHEPPRQAAAIWALRAAVDLEPLRKPHWVNLARLRRLGHYL